MMDRRKLPKGRLGVLPKRDKAVRPEGELGWLTPVRAAAAGGGWWLWTCRCGEQVSKLSKSVRKHAAEGGTPKCSVKCTWKATEAVA